METRGWGSVRRRCQAEAANACSQVCLPSEVSTTRRVVGRLCSMVTFDPEELSCSVELSFVLK